MNLGAILAAAWAVISWTVAIACVLALLGGIGLAVLWLRNACRSGRL